MNVSEWVFILSGIVGVLFGSLMGARRIQGRVRDRDLVRRAERDPARTEVRAFVASDSVDVVVRRLEEAGARDFSITPVDAIRYVGARGAVDDSEVESEESAPHGARLEVACSDDDDASVFADVLRNANEEDGLGVSRVYVSTIGPAID